MPTDTGASPACTHHNGHRVPSHDALDAAFDGPIARIGWLPFERDRVEVRRVGREGRSHIGLPCPIQQVAQQKLRPLRAAGSDHRLQGFDPIAGLTRVRVGGALEATRHWVISSSRGGRLPQSHRACCPIGAPGSLATRGGVRVCVSCQVSWSGNTGLEPLYLYAHAGGWTMSSAHTTTDATACQVGASGRPRTSLSVFHRSSPIGVAGLSGEGTTADHIGHKDVLPNDPEC